LGSRHSGLTLAAGSGWTVINHYYNKSDKEASVVAFGHAWYSQSKWRFKVHAQLVPFVMPNPFSNQFATLANPRTLVVPIPPQQKFEVEAKNDSGNPHVYESILEYDGEPDVSALEGEEVTTEAAVQQSWLVSMGEITTDLIPQLDATLSLGSSSKKWLNAHLANLYAGTLKQNLACDAGITIDGYDISAVFANISRVRAYQSTVQSIPNATATKVNLQTENYDALGEFDNATSYRFTATYAGYYLVIGSAGIQTMSDQGLFNVRIVKNAVTLVSQFGVRGSGAADLVISVKDVVYLAVGDTLELQVFQQTGAARDLYALSDTTFLAIHRFL